MPRAVRLSAAQQRLLQAWHVGLLAPRSQAGAQLPPPDSPCQVAGGTARLRGASEQSQRVRVIAEARSRIACEP